jgi:hypothetical protein
MSNQFPSVRYHCTLPPVVAKSQEEVDALGKEWADTPAAFDEPAPEPEPEPEPAEEPEPEHAPKRRGNRK